MPVARNTGQPGADWHPNPVHSDCFILRYLPNAPSAALKLQMEIVKDALDLNAVWEIIDGMKRAMLGIVTSTGSVTDDAKSIALVG